MISKSILYIIRILIIIILMEIHHLGIIIPKKNYEKIKIIFYL